MKKNDVILIIVLLVIIGIFFFLRKDGRIASVYYMEEKILEIDLNKDDIYVVEGDNGDVTIEVRNKMIRVESENSPKHLCSKQGFTNKQGSVIVCLPNKIVIKIEDSSNKIDGVV